MRGTGMRDSVPKTLLARALYDNRPDCSDELAFSRGDILTILEQNVPESDGWWKCLLHGRQGLAPANRLQVLAEAPADKPCSLFPRGLDTHLASSEKTYQVPTLLRPPPSGPVYEPMKSWVEGSLPATAQVYVLPDPPSSARIICEKTLTFPEQTLVVLPRPTMAKMPALPSQVYDVPAQSRGSLAHQKPEKPPLYDIPAGPQKAALHPSASQASGQSLPPAPVTTLGRGGSYITITNPPKSEWTYDTPASLGKADVRNGSLISSIKESGSHTVQILPPQLCKDAQEKIHLPESPLYASPKPQGTRPSDIGVSYKVPSGFLVPRVERQNTEPNIYDIPKARRGEPRAGDDLRKAREAPENSMDQKSSWIPRQTTSLFPEPDRLSISSSDSRASVVSSCSSVSTDSSSSSSSEDPAREFFLDMDMARETAMALQHKVVSSAGGLLLFVSRTWRFRESLEANIAAIRRAATHMEKAVREFLDFAHEVCGAACGLTDRHLQARIRDQLRTISDSYQILLDSKGRLDGCNWALEVLATNKVQNSLDDLERFVMVARMVPEDVKRLAAIFVANGRLLFKQSCEKEETTPLTSTAEPKGGRCISSPSGGAESRGSSPPLNRQGANECSPELAKKSKPDVCGQSLRYLSSPLPSRQNLEKKKIRLSEHCRLYFGALLKGLGVLASSLSNSQPPEVFITQSKLVITVGQKLVDTLCQETQEKDERNQVLRSSSHLCGLLKDLALATKSAAIQYPSPAALGHLQTEVKKLEQHTRQFRGTLE